MAKDLNVTFVVTGDRIKAHDPRCAEVSRAREDGRMIMTMYGVDKVPRDVPLCKCLRLAQ